jgi:hypothetical protein
MKDAMRRSFRHHNADKQLAEKYVRIDQIAALCDATKRGGIGVDRALVEIIETARGDAAAVVRVGEEIRPDLRTGETR